MPLASSNTHGAPITFYILIETAAYLRTYLFAGFVKVNLYGLVVLSCQTSKTNKCKRCVTPRHRTLKS
uniref:Uncharacterized protein n=1 Tax=Arundo donax TaxID=35708 RepID=A0A0A9SMQ3_ARUDO